MDLLVIHPFAVSHDELQVVAAGSDMEIHNHPVFLLGSQTTLCLLQQVAVHGRMTDKAPHIGLDDTDCDFFFHLILL
jgi:hypothetical protein